MGPARTQWRKCSDKYYPYSHLFVDRNDIVPSQPDPLIPNTKPWKPPPIISSPDFRPSHRPDRPFGKPTRLPPKPSLDEYESQFEHQFLDPPKPGGFGLARHWPVAYLHKELPPDENVTEIKVSTTMVPKLRSYDGKNATFQAIQNLIDIIKATDAKMKYTTSNFSQDDAAVHIKIPLISKEENSMNKTLGNFEAINVPPTEVTLKNPTRINLGSTRALRSSNEDVSGNEFDKSNEFVLTSNSGTSGLRTFPAFRRGTVTKTTIENYGKLRTRRTHRNT